jgi:LPS-assembly lipoprotein
MKRNNIFAAVFILAAAFLMTACGFHLRGSTGDADMSFKTIFVGFPDSSTLGVELKRNIRSSGTTQVVNDRKQAQVILESLAETKRKVVLSLNSQGRVREYSLFYLVRFQIKDQKGAVLLPPTDIELRRTLAYNEAQALAKEAEEAMLYRDMQSDLVQQILRRLAALKIPA